MKECKLDGCNKESRRSGYCVNHNYHYKQGNLDFDGNWLKEINLRIYPSSCKIESCGNKSEVKGYCLNCYKKYALGIIDKTGNDIERIKKNNKKWVNYKKEIYSNDKRIYAGNEKKEKIVIIDKKSAKKVEINYKGCCKVMECGFESKYKIGFCNKHYQNYKNGNLNKNGSWVKKIQITQPSAGCKITDCVREHFAKGYCSKHYKQLKKGKIIDCEVDLDNYKSCKVDDCGDVTDSHGFCGKHVYHFKIGNLDKNGKWIKEPKRKRNTSKFTECIVDDCGGNVLAKGLCQKHYSTWIRKKNENWIRERYFDDSKFICSDCGEEFLFCQIDFHHGSEKNFKIGEQMNNSKLPKRQDIIDELDKGDWLCTRCHMNRHFNPEFTFYESKSDKKRGKSMDLAYRDIIERRGCNCNVCGDILLPKELEFHHKDSKELESRIADMVGWQNIDKIMEEVDKCDLVCRNCHRLVHYAEREFAGIDLDYFDKLFKLNKIKI